jgi:SAM-dependent methyltransferase
MTTRPGEQVSQRWAQWRADLPIEAYEARFARQEARGEHIHGEADFICRYEPASVLDAGCGTGRVAIELARRGIEVAGVDLDDEMLAAARLKEPEIEWICADLAGLDLDRTFDVVAMPGNIPLFCRPEDRVALVAGVARHVAPNGMLIAGFSLEPGGYDLGSYDAHCALAGLKFADRFSTWDGDPYTKGNYAVSVHVPR